MLNTSSDLIELKITLSDNTELIIPVRQDGYVNVTKLCKAGGKEYSKWKENKNSEATIQALERVLGIPRTEIIKVKQGGNNQGTFVHRRLALIIAQWIDPYFALQMNDWIKKNEQKLEQKEQKEQKEIFQTQSSDIIELKLTLKNNTELSIPVSKDGYVNCTKLCKAGNKRIDNWIANKQSKELLNAYSTIPGIQGIAFSRIIKGGDSSLNNQGTYYPMAIAIQIAQWISPNIALQVNDWIKKNEQKLEQKEQNEHKLEQKEQKEQNEHKLEQKENKENKENVVTTIDKSLFTLNNSKLLKLTKEMIINNEVKTTLEFAQKFMFTFDSEEQFPINIDMLIEMKVYDRKDHCKTKLTKNFILNTEFKVQKAAPEFSGAAFNIQKATNIDKGGAGKNKENIMLTIDCFKSMCMLSNSDAGKQIKLYYLDLERIFKRYIILKFQEKQLQLTHSNLQLKNEQIEKQKYLTLHNQHIKKHNFHKFKKNGPCFYIIVSGLEYKDEITRIKIGICGCRKKKTSESVINSEDCSLDHRLASHRTLWPQLQVKFAVYTEHAALLESNMKLVYQAQINPNGHELIERVPIFDVIEKTKMFLNNFNGYNNDIQTYCIEENIEQYNVNTLTHIKNNILQITEVIEEKKEKIEIIKDDIKEAKEVIYEQIEVIKESEEKLVKINAEIAEYKIHLAKNIEEYKDAELKDLLSKCNMTKNGKKYEKFNRFKLHINKEIKRLEILKNQNL